MKGGPAPAGGEQFPPVDDLPASLKTIRKPNGAPGGPGPPMGAMDRLNDRQNASGEPGQQQIRRL